MTGIVTKKDLLRERSLTANNKIKDIKKGNPNNPYGYMARSKMG
jgi:hypothetical protein